MNKELSRKLEVQTQRLELLTAQSMGNKNISAKQPDSHAMYETTPYADEGDEVTYVQFTLLLVIMRTCYCLHI